MLLSNLKKPLFILCAGAMFTFTSCSGENSENSENIEAEETEVVEDAIDELNMDESNEILSEGENVEGNAPITIGNEGNVQAGVKLNPPHGQPGHDCAVPVGDPLPGSANISMPSTTLPTGTTPSVAIPSNTKAANLNPPHGQPGHDCAVPVGSPLN